LGTRVLEHLHRNFTDSQLSLTSISMALNVNETYLSTYFKQKFNENLSNYLERQRIEYACRLLSDTATPIQEIAGKVGYHNDQSFRRAFKRVMGVQPSRLRKS
jgi:YesN/AraC family two-component response regulator